MKAHSEYRQAVVRFKRTYIREALEKNNGNVTATALELGLHPGYLHKQVRLLGIRGGK